MEDAKNVLLRKHLSEQRIYLLALMRANVYGICTGLVWGELLLDKPRSYCVQSNDFVSACRPSAVEEVHGS